MQQEMDELRDVLSTLTAGLEGGVGRLDTMILALEEYEVDEASLRAWLDKTEQRVEVLQAPLDREQPMQEFETNIEVQ